MPRTNEFKNKDVFIEGRNLILREVRVSDVTDKYLRWMRNPEVNQFLESRFQKWNINKLKEYVKKLKDDPDFLFLAITTKNGRHIGNTKLGPINHIHKFADLGITIGEKDCWGKGFASEAIRLVVDYSFKNLSLHKITAGTYENNIGSIKAFKKSGFKIEGVRKKHYLYNGNYIDLISLGIVNLE